jgi:hypothetical protein
MTDSPAQKHYEVMYRALNAFHKDALGLLESLRDYEAVVNDLGSDLDREPDGGLQLAIQCRQLLRLAHLIEIARQGGVEGHKGFGPAFVRLSAELEAKTWANFAARLRQGEDHWDDWSSPMTSDYEDCMAQERINRR